MTDQYTTTTTGGYPESQPVTADQVIAEDGARGNLLADQFQIERIGEAALAKLKDFQIEIKSDAREVILLAAASAQRLLRLSLTVGGTAEGNKLIETEARHIKAQLLNAASERTPHIQRAVREALGDILGRATQVAIAALA